MAFKRVTVDFFFNPALDRRVLVEWALDRAYNAPGPYEFTLYRGYAVNDDSLVALATTTDQTWAYDIAPIFPTTGRGVVYQVKLVDGNGDTFWSPVATLGENFTRYDWSLAREITRKELLLQRKLAGTPGFLLKRRLFGTFCTDCTNADTGQVVAPCDTCYGTGVVGGYYPPLEYWLILDPNRRVTKLTGDLGIISDTMETARALAYAFPVGGDVWVNAATDQRYTIAGDVTAVARMRGIDLVYNLRLEERGRNDMVYKIPMPCPT